MSTSFARPFISALAALLIGGTLAIAQGPGPGAGPGGVGPGFNSQRPTMVKQFGNHLFTTGRWWNRPRMIQALKLTEDQRKAMDAILFKHREQLIDLHANLQKTELGMHPLMSASQPDQKAIESQIDKIIAARGALEKANALFLLDIRMKLTADQWKQLQDMRAAMRDHRGPGMMRQWHGRGPAGPPPGSPNMPAPPPAGSSDSGSQQ
ncbi:MAG: Spy/CpxP family protein refolding chaperone [Acidobacteriota bacterium]